VFNAVATGEDLAQVPNGVPKGRPDVAILISDLRLFRDDKPENPNSYANGPVGGAERAGRMTGMGASWQEADRPFSGENRKDWTFTRPSEITS
jgi:hypothetical protein